MMHLYILFIVLTVCTGCRSVAVLIVATVSPNNTCRYISSLVNISAIECLRLHPRVLRAGPLLIGCPVDNIPHYLGGLPYIVLPDN